MTAETWIRVQQSQVWGGLMNRDDARRHPVTGRFLAFDCETDCQEHCSLLCGVAPFPNEESNDEC